jgi:hypothetical protein
VKLVDSANSSNVLDGVDTIAVIRYVVVEIQRFPLPFVKIKEAATRISVSAADALGGQRISSLTVVGIVSVDNVDRNLVSSLRFDVSVLILCLDLHYSRVSRICPVKGSA